MNKAELVLSCVLYVSVLRKEHFNGKQKVGLCV